MHKKISHKTSELYIANLNKWYIIVVAEYRVHQLEYMVHVNIFISFIYDVTEHGCIQILLYMHYEQKYSVYRSIGGT